jgi:hypothetical protein
VNPTICLLTKEGRRARHVRTIVNLHFLIFAITLCLLTPSWSQEIEARRWNHLPIGVNFGGGGYVYTAADIAFDPVVLLDDVTMDLNSLPIKYLRSFELLGMSARAELWQAYQDAHWKGTINGVPAGTTRSGWSDMTLRVAVDLIGAPPLDGEEYKKYRAGVDVETLVGLGLAVQIPTGHYIDDKLLNLGSNRFTFRPQLGVVHNRGKWSIESTFATWFYTDNDNFFGGKRLEQAPFYTLDGHVDYTFRPGLWAGAGLGYGLGAASTINGIDKNDTRENIGWEFSCGYPFSPQLGLKLAYTGLRTRAPVGADSDSIATVLSVLW